MLARVSSLETFRRWRHDDDATLEDIVDRLTSFEPTEKMLAGTAFHKALELAEPGEFDTLEADGFIFRMPDAELELPSIRELRAHRDYGPLRVTGKVDCLLGQRIDDHKTTGSFRPESYLDGYQWRFYLDIFGADRFRWNVFEITPISGEDRVYSVKPPHILEQVRYPGLRRDCESLAREFYDFASLHLPDYAESLES